MRCGEIVQIALSCVLAGCLLLGCQSGDTPNLNENTWGNTSGNILQNGNVTVSDGVIYYNDSNPENGGLYRLDQDGKIIKLGNQNAYNINVVDNTVYFLDGLPGQIWQDKGTVLLSGPKNNKVTKTTQKKENPSR